MIDGVLQNMASSGLSTNARCPGGSFPASIDSTLRCTRASDYRLRGADRSGYRGEENVHPASIFGSNERHGGCHVTRTNGTPCLRCPTLARRTSGAHTPSRHCITSATWHTKTERFQPARIAEPAPRKPPRLPTCTSSSVCRDKRDGCLRVGFRLVGRLRHALRHCIGHRLELGETCCDLDERIVHVRRPSRFTGSRN